MNAVCALAAIGLILAAEIVHAAEVLPENQPALTNRAIVPFESRRGRTLIRARVNDSEPLLFLLDSGFEINMISPEKAEALQLRRVGKITIVGVAGEERADTFEGVVFDFGSGFTYSSRRIASSPSHNNRFARLDGVLGAGLYRQFTVEVDPAAKHLVLYRPQSFQYSGTGEVVPLKFRKSTPVMTASILVPGQAPIEGEFEVDTGCDGGLCLGSDFVRKSELEEKLEPGSTSARKGVGGVKKTRSVRLPQLQIGKLVVDRPSADLFEDGSPAEPGLAGHIGMEIWRQFRVTFDYSRKRLIMEPLKNSAKPASP
jgi:hypothetical protein